MAQLKCNFFFLMLLKNGGFYLSGANNVDIMTYYPLNRREEDAEVKRVTF